jgi:thioredoxin reductase
VSGNGLPEEPSRLFDAVIVGGGPAGLSAALILGRCLHQVLLCDAGKPRNAPSRMLSGFLSRDGVNPAEFLAIARQQVAQYTSVEQRKATVVDAEKQGDRFIVTLEDRTQVQARLVLLATGVVDELPEIEGFAEFYGKTVHSCPYCDAWEHRGQPLAIYGRSPEAAALALELRTWSDDVILCSDGQARFGSRDREQLERMEVRMIETAVARLEGTDEALRGIRFVDGTLLPRSAVFFSPGQFQQSPLAQKLGCELCGETGCVKSDSTCATRVEGLYVAGNSSEGIQLAIVAAAEGASAAIAMNEALGQKRLEELEARAGQIPKPCRAN